jgi:mono/diheme cytochrome c family protein
MATCEVGAARGPRKTELNMLGRFVALSALCIAGACAPEPAQKREAAGEARGAPLAEVGVASLGRAYAEQSCASCHAVAPGRFGSPNPKAPAFQTVADTPGMTRMALNVWLHTSHPSMSNLIVDPDRIEDLSAYIATLKTKRAPS